MAKPLFTVIKIVKKWLICDSCITNTKVKQGKTSSIIDVLYISNVKLYQVVTFYFYKAD